VRRTPPAGGGTNRISLELPAEPASVALAENAAAGILVHRNIGRPAARKLVAVSAELTDAAVSRARRRGRLWLHYDIAEAEIAVTVELRRAVRRLGGRSFRETVIVGAEDPRSRP
jgi:hypothetical protein